MTVETNVSKAQFLGSGSAGPFTFDFKFYTNDEISVVKISSLGVETELTEGVNYTLSGAGNHKGGSLTLHSVLAEGESLVIVRMLELIQPTSIRNLGAFFPEIHEETFDRIVMLIQQINSGVNELKSKQQIEVLDAVIQAVAVTLSQCSLSATSAIDSKNSAAQSAIDSAAAAIGVQEIKDSMQDELIDFATSLIETQTILITHTAFI